VAFSFKLRYNEERKKV